MVGPRKVHEISDSDEEEVKPVPSAPKRSRQGNSPAKQSQVSSTNNHNNNDRKATDPVSKYSARKTVSAASSVPPVKDLRAVPNNPDTSSKEDKAPTQGTLIRNGLEKNIEMLRKGGRETQSTGEISYSETPSTEGDTRPKVPPQNENNEDLPPCPHGFTCYRTGAEHLQENSHASRTRGFYLTKCEGLQSKYNADTFTRSLKQILHEDVGDELESAVHFSYIYDIEWLIEQYPPAFQRQPMLLVVQHSDDLLGLLIAQRQVYRNVSLLPVQLARFGTHHSKMILLKYKSHLRIIVTTANLYGPDWDRKSQMVWLSPLLKKTEDSNEASDSATGFRSALCTYLRSYQKKKLVDLAESFFSYDFSPITCCYFIGSSPNSINSGLVTVDTILSKNVPPLAKENPVTFCFSSIGTLGQDDSAWLRSTLGRSLLANDKTTQGVTNLNEVSRDNIQAIYPTVEEVRRSLEGYEAGRSLPYSGKVHMRQRWLSQWLHHWKADRVGRSRAAPHVKFYIRTSADYQQTFWFLMSSANLSKAAWGNLRTKAPLSYESGILFIPERPLRTNDVVLPFDLPPQRYASPDKLWIQDNAYAEVDDYGNTWDPRNGGAVPTVA